MLKRLPWVILPLLAGCLDAPSPPSPPGPEVRASIINSDGIEFDTVYFSTFDSLCISAKLSDSTFDQELIYRWMIEGYEYGDQPNFCLPVVEGAIGTASIHLEIEDKNKTILKDSVVVFANTAPVFDTTRSHFFPAENQKIDLSSGQEIPFRWAARDFDDFDTLRYTVRIGEKGKWLDTLQTFSNAGIQWRGNLNPGTKYDWQVIVSDWASYQDSTPVFHFITKETWDSPYYIIGSVQNPYPEFPQLRTRIKVIVQSSQGDTITLAVNDSFDFRFYAGSQSDSLTIFAFNEIQQRYSDTMRVLPDHLGPVGLPSTLEFAP